MIRSSLVAVTLLIAGSQVAWAQPATDAAPKSTNPANTNGVFNDEQKQKMLKQMDEMAKMTPEQLKAQMRNINHQLLSSTLTRSGFTDASLQETILAFVDEQEKARGDVRQAASKLYLASEPRAVATDDKAVEVLLEDFLAAVDEARTNRDIAIKALDTKIRFSTKPRLRAVLLLNGLIGDAAPMTADIVMSGTMAMGAVAQAQGDVLRARP